MPTRLYTCIWDVCYGSNACSAFRFIGSPSLIQGCPAPWILNAKRERVRACASRKQWVHCMSLLYIYISKINMRVIAALHSVLNWQALENALSIHSNISRAAKRVYNWKHIFLSVFIPKESYHRLCNAIRKLERDQKGFTIKNTYSLQFPLQ